MARILDYFQTFLILFIELAALFIFISFLVSLIQQKVTEERIKQILNQSNSWLAYLYGTLFGALTPFCSCSTIPILAGLLSSKAPFGPSMSFLIASPLLNPVIILLLWTLLGWQLTLYYAIITGIFAILIGVVLSQLGLHDAVKNVVVRKGNVNKEQNLPKWKLALQDAWSFFYPILPYLVLGVLIGAAIYDFVPKDWIVKYAGGNNIWTIPVAAVIGIPMYIRAETILPIADALVSKGMDIGSVIALVIGGAGASIPEVILLGKLFKQKLVVAFVLSILIVAIGTGLIIQRVL